MTFASDACLVRIRSATSFPISKIYWGTIKYSLSQQPKNLYIGKAKNLRDRLRGGHKAFFWSWLDRYEPDEVRIAYVTINQWQRPGLSYELETLIL